jgi:hypothetical protein
VGLGFYCTHPSTATKTQAAQSYALGKQEICHNLLIPFRLGVK